MIPLKIQPGHIVYINGERYVVKSVQSRDNTPYSVFDIDIVQIDMTNHDEDCYYI